MKKDIRILYNDKLDKSLAFPKDISFSSKNVSGLLRKKYNLDVNQDISELFQRLADDKNTEEVLFNKNSFSNKDYFVVRVLLFQNVSLKLSKKRVLFSKVLGDHFALQIGDKIVYFHEELLPKLYIFQKKTLRFN